MLRPPKTAFHARAPPFLEPESSDFGGDENHAKTEVEWLEWVWSPRFLRCGVAFLRDVSSERPAGVDLSVGNYNGLTQPHPLEQGPGAPPGKASRRGAHTPNHCRGGRGLTDQESSVSFACLLDKLTF